MADEPKREGGRGCVVAVAIGIVLLPVLYFLSVGPAGLAIGHGLIPHRLLNVVYAFYAPLNWLAERSETFKAFGEWYCDLLGL